MSIDTEIAQQPEALRHAIASACDAAPAVADAVRGRGITHVVIAARGTSDNAAVYAQYLWGRHLRLPVALTTPSLFAGDAPPRLDGALVVGVSQSGASPDLVAVLAEARRQARPTLAVTNVGDSPLAQHADVVVDLAAGEERAVAATKTYTSSLVALAVLTDALAEGLGGEWVGGEAVAVAGHLDGVAEAAAAVLEADPLTPPLLRLLEGRDRIAVVGRGLDLATAREWALKLQELSGVLAHHWSTADFRHGPFALAADGLPGAVVSTDAGHADEARALVADLVEAGADPLLVTDRPPREPRCEVVALPPADPLCGPITAIVAAQLATVALTRRRGRDADQPALLSKVTLTR